MYTYTCTTLVLNFNIHCVGSLYSLLTSAADTVLVVFNDPWPVHSLILWMYISTKVERLSVVACLVAAGSQWQTTLAEPVHSLRTAYVPVAQEWYMIHGCIHTVRVTFLQVYISHLFLLSLSQSVSIALRKLSKGLNFRTKLSNRTIIMVAHGHLNTYVCTSTTYACSWKICWA